MPFVSSSAFRNGHFDRNGRLDGSGRRGQGDGAGATGPGVGAGAALRVLARSSHCGLKVRARMRGMGQNAVDAACRTARAS